MSCRTLICYLVSALIVLICRLICSVSCCLFGCVSSWLPEQRSGEQQSKMVVDANKLQKHVHHLVIACFIASITHIIFCVSSMWRCPRTVFRPHEALWSGRLARQHTLSLPGRLRRPGLFQYRGECFLVSQSHVWVSSLPVHRLSKATVYVMSSGWWAR